MAHHYNPDQPRVPRGHDEGGQWTKGIPAPLSELDAILNPRGEDGRAGTVQLAFLDAGKPPIRLKLPGGLGILGLAAEIIHSYLSKDNNDKQRTILSLKTYEFRRYGDNDFDFKGARILTGDDIKKECGDLDKIQEYTDRAFEEVDKNYPKLLPTERGKKVHKLVEKWIKADPYLEDVSAEITFAKADSETGDETPNARHTVRLDIFNKVDDETLCITDIKTGNEGLSYNRMLELVAAASKKHEGIKRIIVTRVKPSDPRVPKPKRTLQHE